MNYKQMIRVVGALLLLCVTSNLAYSSDMEHVTVEQGALQGKTEGNLTVFKGVPFAKPPVGELRWKAPQPAESWTGTHQALEFAPSPIQAGEPPAGKSEDGLYLNIWTPAVLPLACWPLHHWPKVCSTGRFPNVAAHLARQTHPATPVKT